MDTKEIYKILRDLYPHIEIDLIKYDIIQLLKKDEEDVLNTLKSKYENMNMNRENLKDSNDILCSVCNEFVGVLFYNFLIEKFLQMESCINVRFVSLIFIFVVYVPIWGL
jgi:hypothetical protein